MTYTLSDGKKIQKVTDVVTGTGSVVRAVSFQHRWGGHGDGGGQSALNVFIAVCFLRGCTAILPSEGSGEQAHILIARRSRHRNQVWFEQ